MGKELGEAGRAPRPHASLILQEEERIMVLGSKQPSAGLSGRTKSQSCSSEESQVSQKWACLSTFPELSY